MSHGGTASMPLRVQCGKCGSPFGAKDELAGRTVKCPKCASPIAIPVAAAAAKPAQPSRAAAGKSLPKARPIAPGPSSGQPTSKPVRQAPASPAQGTKRPVQGTRRPAQPADEFGLGAAVPSGSASLDDLFAAAALTEAPVDLAAIPTPAPQPVASQGAKTTGKTPAGRGVPPGSGTHPAGRPQPCC